MTKQCALKTILVISIAGILFSGFLSYQELFGNCEVGCSSPTSHLLSIPVCVYGFIMYTIVFLVSLIGIKSKK